MVRLPPDLLAALDAHMVEDGRIASRPDWIRQALRDWLVSKGRLGCPNNLNDVG
ncbi:ribbon-helix-helix domain-containing protein [Methylobacterium bullatum]|uniref:ribbon-helix-helix domain-containing protein n=1 Tax=Methylobacterium bullatum TaxID=570505 RepID=UPI003BB027B4